MRWPTWAVVAVGVLAAAIVVVLVGLLTLLPIAP